MNDLRQAFERLATGFQKPVYNAAVRLAGNPEDGLDIARETFVRAYALYVAGRRSGAFRPWLYQVLVDVYNEWYSSTAKAPQYLEALDSRLELGLEISSGARGLDCFRGPEQSPVEQALGALPEELRLSLVLSDVEGFSYSQISRILRIPFPTVGIRILQARRMLRAAMREQTTRRPPIEK